MEVLREEKQLCFCPWMNKQQGGREIAVRGCSAQSWRVKSLCVDEQCEEGTDCGGEQQNREVANCSAWVFSKLVEPRKMSA